MEAVTEMFLTQVSRAIVDNPWCPDIKGLTLASMVMAMRPKVVVEIGVWEGGSLIPMAIAAKAIGNCRVYAIDPWSADASVQYQNDINAAWWADAPHEAAYQRFLERLKQFDVTDVVEVVRTRSDRFSMYMEIDIWHCDGNHSEEAINDVLRFAPCIRRGGIAIMDDIHWETNDPSGGGKVEKAVEILELMGFTELYELGTGAVFQRTGLTA